MLFIATRPCRKGFLVWGHEHQYDRVYHHIFVRRLKRLGLL